MIQERLSRIERRCGSNSSDRGRAGFTLVELLVVIAIIGVMVSLLLPAVQYAREAGRRASCSNNLRNHALALTNYHDTQRKYPPGHMLQNGLGYSWASYMLPQLEQQPVYDQIDFTAAWDSSRNESPRTTGLSIFRCPSSLLEFPGDTDYAGVLGSLIVPQGTPTSGDLSNRGALILYYSPSDIVAANSVLDGLSNTLCIAEHRDTPAEDRGFWLSGVSCISHDRGAINTEKLGILGAHASGAFAARLDGSVVYLSRSVSPFVVGALCTRNGNETVTNFE